MMSSQIRLSIAVIMLFASTAPILSQYQSANLLQKYRTFLEEYTIRGPQERPHQSRAYTFQKAFEWFEEHHGKVIVELGTTRSFVNGGLAGCCSPDVRFWQPKNPASWDWGAGGFTRIAAECLAHCNPEFHTVDCDASHLAISKTITKEYAQFMHYHHAYSQNFLRQCAPESIDLLYLDTGNIDYETALLHLEEAKIIVERNVLAPHGIILIDDVKHPIPGEPLPLGKARFSIPYFLDHGFEIIENEYQVILRKKQ